MAFFINHYAFTICIISCLLGTILYTIAPVFCNSVLCVNSHRINLGTLGTSIFIQSSFVYFCLSMVVAIPGLLYCENFYGEEITLIAVIGSGIYFGLVGLIFGKSNSGFAATGILLDCMACFYGLHWYGILLGVIVLITAISLDCGNGTEERIMLLAALAGIGFSIGFGITTGRYDIREFKEKKSYSIVDDFICPIVSDFSISSFYGYRIDPFSGCQSFHKGIDMACAEDTKIEAAYEGVVESIGYDKIYGNNVVINHGNGYKTKYAHMNRIDVKKGDFVEQGHSIGIVGNTGYSTGPHLHFMILKNGKCINPKDVIKK